MTTLREQILTILKARPGEWISGEALSVSFGVSRTAVWKQVRRLVEAGYAIESMPKKGYRINSRADILSPAEVGPGLLTQVLGREGYHYHRELDSTNDRAKALAAQGAPEGTVVVAEYQTAGRGRRGRTWYSPAHQGIYVSLILRPLLAMDEIARIPLITAVAVAETLRSTLGLEARIKWPNDILVNDRKIAGILAEAVTDMDGVEFVVVGIGLNINNEDGDFPGDLRMPATSARAEEGQPVSRVLVLQALLASLERYYHQLLAGDFRPALDKLRSWSTVIGRQVRFDTVKGSLTGRALAIDDDGCLQVADPDGVIHTLMSGEIGMIS